MRFSVPITGLGHPEHPYAACFVDYVQALVAALRELGHEVVPPTVDGFNADKTARPVVFGAQETRSLDVASDKGSFVPADAILYNSEQTGAKGVDPAQIFKAVSTWKKRVVWDYSKVNAEVLRSMGCERVVHCPVGYSPAMTRIAPLPPERQDIDVLFYGSVASPLQIAQAARKGIKILDRGGILADCKRAGLKVQHVFGVFGCDLDQYVARAKVVLNLHYYEGAVFEIFRCSQLLANKKAVVTESGGVDAELELFAENSCVYASRGEIVDECLALCDDQQWRREIEERGYAEFKKTSLVENVRQALVQS